MRRKELVGTFIALSLGVTMLTLAALTFWSAQPQVPQRLSGAPILISRTAPDFATPPLLADPESLLARLEAVPGVLQAIRDTPVYAQPIVGGKPVPNETSGNSWDTLAMASFGLSSGRAPSGGDEVAVSDSLGVAPGGRLTILTADGPSDYTVTGTVSGPGVFFPKPFPGVRSIGLLTRGDVDLARVESAVAGQAEIFTGEDRAALEPPADARLRWIGMQVISAISALSAFAAVFLVASTFSFSVLQRRRELALLRTIGATPKQLRGMMFREALGLGAAACVVGTGLGAAGAPLLGRLLVDAGFEPPSFAIAWHPLPLIAAPAAGMLVALAGVWAAARRAAKVRPLEALRVAEVERAPMTLGRWIGGVAALGFGALMAFGAVSSDPLNLPTLAMGAAMAFTVGLSLLAPVFVPPLARLVMTPWRRGALGLLVRQNAFTAARRTASTAAPVLLSVAFAVLISGMVQTTTTAFAARRADALPAPVALVPDGTPGLTGAQVRAAGDGLAITFATVFLDGKPLSVLGRSDQTVIAAAAWVKERSFEVTVASGHTVRVEVAEVAEDAPADLVVPREWVLRHDPSALTDAVLLPRVPATAPAPGARIVDAATYAAEADAAEDRLVWTFTLLLILTAVGFTVLAVANTLLMASVGRRREWRLLGRTGATRGQVLGLIATESALVVLLGTGLGLIVALPALVAIRAGLSEQIGLPVPLVVPWGTLATVAGVCLLFGVVASLLPQLGRHANGDRA